MANSTKQYCIALVYRSPVGFRCNQRSAHVNMILRGGDVQGGLFAEGTGNQQQMSEAQHNTKKIKHNITTSAERFQSTMQVK